MVLGDPDQAICAYRGATSAENFAAFARDFPEHDVVTLERNYRSTATILTAANALIAANRGRLDKRLWTTGPAGDPIAVEDWRRRARRGAADRHVGARAPRRRRAAVGSCASSCASTSSPPASSRRSWPPASRCTSPARSGSVTAPRSATPSPPCSLVANPRDRLAFARVAKAAGAGVGEAACRALFAHADAPSAVRAARARRALTAGRAATAPTGGGPRAVRRTAGGQPTGRSGSPATWRTT